MFAIFLICIACCVSFSAAQTNAELAAIAEQIWAADVNRFPDAGCVYNEAGPTLYTFVNEALLGQSTFAPFVALLDNYETVIGVPEPSCPTCRTEEQVFLNAIMATEVIQLLHGFLVTHGLASSDEAAFQDELWTYWFQFYSRSSGPLDSSGFEHTFLGEVRGASEVTGFHNWVQAYLEEKAGRFQYGTHLDTCQPENLKYSFSWDIQGNTYNKPISGNFMKTSPEAELALYTLCFRARRNQLCPITLEGFAVNIQTYDFQGRDNVGSSYPAC